MDLICCPQCEGDLKLSEQRERELTAREAGVSGDRDVVEGLLICRSCQAAYPIAHGIPRFYRNALRDYPNLRRSAEAFVSRVENVPDDPLNIKTRQTFTQEWSEHKPGDVTWEWRIEERCGLFLKEMMVQPADVANRVILDAGCGNGELTNALAKYGAEVVGIDMSNSVERADRLRTSSAVHFIQGDLHFNPLRRRAFDLIYSSGVLHHTPDCERAFELLCRRLQPGGRIYVWLYGAPDEVEMCRLEAENARVFRWKPFLNRFPTTIQRWLLMPIALLWVFRSRYRTTIDEAKRRLWPAADQLSWLQRIALLPVFLYLRMRTFRSAPPNRDLTLAHALVQVFDLYTPPFRSHHHFQEVRGWFDKQGLSRVTLSEVRQTGFGVCGDSALLQSNKERLPAALAARI
jgi:SAM-dependent methyltransferase